MRETRNQENVRTEYCSFKYADMMLNKYLTTPLVINVTEVQIRPETTVKLGDVNIFKAFADPAKRKIFRVRLIIHI